MITVEKNVELPRERVRNSYPFKLMDIGDSFFIDNVKMQIVCNANYRANKALNKKFIARREGNGVRVWRIA